MPWFRLKAGWRNNPQTGSIGHDPTLGNAALGALVRVYDLVTEQGWRGVARTSSGYVFEDWYLAGAAGVSIEEWRRLRAAFTEAGIFKDDPEDGAIVIDALVESAEKYAEVCERERVKKASQRERKRAADAEGKQAKPKGMRAATIA